jgi:hypothetical protein
MLGFSSALVRSKSSKVLFLSVACRQTIVIIEVAMYRPLYIPLHSLKQFSPNNELLWEHKLKYDATSFSMVVPYEVVLLNLEAHEIDIFSLEGDHHRSIYLSFSLRNIEVEDIKMFTFSQTGLLAISVLRKTRRCCELYYYRY